MQMITFVFLDLDLPVISGKQHVFAREGLNIFMSCFAKGYPKVRYQWYFNGQFLQNGSVLFILDVWKKFEGNYTCIASNELKKMESNPAWLNVILCECTDITFCC